MQGSFHVTLRSSFSDLAPELLREPTLPRAETIPSAWFADARFEALDREAVPIVQPELVKTCDVSSCEAEPQEPRSLRHSGLAAEEHICGTGGHDRCRVVFEDFDAQSRLHRARREWLEADVERRAPAPIDPRHEGRARRPTTNANGKDDGWRHAFRSRRAASGTKGD